MPEHTQRLSYDQLASSTLTERVGISYSVLSVNDRKCIRAEHCQELKAELFDYIDRHREENVGIDLSGVEFIACSFLNGFILADRQLKKNKRSPLRLTNVRPEIYEVLVITKLNQIFGVD